MRDVILNWELGTNYGWGILGLNLFAQWANDAKLRPVMGQPIELSQLIGVDSLRMSRIVAATNASKRLPPEAKVEFRKAQDLVLLAFQRFAARHADAVLVAAWHSPWVDISHGFRGRLASPLPVGPDGMLDVTRWVVENGIDADQVIDLGPVPNVLMPGILREMHVALQPSRAEACTNLPVKEAMACGVPVIAARNTGMSDLLTEDNCIMLRHQTPVCTADHAGTDGWGESDLEEIDAALEFAYQDRAAAAATGARARQWLLDHGRTWQEHAATLKEWVLTHST